MHIGEAFIAKYTKKKRLRLTDLERMNSLSSIPTGVRNGHSYFYILLHQLQHMVKLNMTGPKVVDEIVIVRM